MSRYDSVACSATRDDRSADVLGFFLRIYSSESKYGESSLGVFVVFKKMRGSFAMERCAITVKVGRLVRAFGAMCTAAPW